MRSVLPTNSIKDNMIITSPDLKKTFPSSKMSNNFIIQTCSNSCCLTDTQTNFSLNSSSTKSTNSPVESTIFSNDSSFNDICRRKNVSS